nr:uncharacterized protein LOC106682347 [Halyomorpha halys]
MMTAADNKPCTRGDVACELRKLIEKLDKAKHRQECYPKRIYPECPPMSPPEPIVVPHPLVKNLNVLNRPRALAQNVKVTVDGRLAELYEPREYYFDEPPLVSGILS